MLAKVVVGKRMKSHQSLNSDPSTSRWDQSHLPTLWSPKGSVALLRSSSTHSLRIAQLLQAPAEAKWAQLVYQDLDRTPQLLYALILRPLTGPQGLLSKLNAGQRGSNDYHSQRIIQNGQQQPCWSMKLVAGGIKYWWCFMVATSHNTSEMVRKLSVGHLSGQLWVCLGCLLVTGAIKGQEVDGSMSRAEDQNCEHPSQGNVRPWWIVWKGCVSTWNNLEQTLQSLNMWRWFPSRFIHAKWFTGLRSAGPDRALLSPHLQLGSPAMNIIHTITYNKNMQKHAKTMYSLYSSLIVYLSGQLLPNLGSRRRRNSPSLAFAMGGERQGWVRFGRLVPCLQNGFQTALRTVVARRIWVPWPRNHVAQGVRSCKITAQHFERPSQH